MPKRAKAKRTEKKELHHVSAALDNWELSKRESAVTFTVRKGGRKLGELSVGRGSVSWLAAKKQYAVTLPWPTLARILEEYGE